MFCGTPFRIAAALPVIVFAGALTLAAQPAPVVQNGWEDGSPQGWVARGPVILTNTANQANSGFRSLLTTGRAAGDHGPSLNVLGMLTNGATYQVSVWVRLTPGTPATQLQMRVARTAGSSFTDSIASTSATGATDSAWTQITGLYSFSGTTPSSLALYIGSSSTTASYYIDDFSIVLVVNPAGPPLNTTGLSATFESGTPEGWVGHLGSETLAAGAAAAHSGSQGLMVTDRASAAAGPALDVTNRMFNGSRYVVSLWARLPAGQPSTNLIVSLQRTAGTIVTTSTVVASKAVTSSSWVRLFTTPVYNVSLPNTSLQLFVQSATGTTTPFYIDDVQVTYVAPYSVETELLSLHDVLAPYFRIGTVSYSSDITGTGGQLLAKHFNSITSENDMKWDASEPSEGNFTFNNADAQVAFAKANGMRVRGHTLTWHSQVPAWVFIDPATGATMLPSAQNKTLLLDRLRNHIKGVVTHFGDAVYAYDVVNEAIDESQTDCMRRSTWYTVTGKDFIDVAFQTARQYAANAVLVYNDYSSTGSAKRQCIYKLVADMKARGIPIDAVGHQMHNSLNSPSVQSMVDTINYLAPLGIDQQVTEMDIGVGNSFTAYNEIPDSVLARQGYLVRDTFNAFRQLSGKLSSVTFWGMSDDHTWLTSATKVDAPLLFDASGHAKPAYWGIVDPSKLPGIGLTGSLASKSGPQEARVWTIKLANPGLGTAYGAQIAKPVLTQMTGSACTPVVTGAFPISLGDIASGASLNKEVTIDFTGCHMLTMFTATIPFSSSNGLNAGTIATTGRLW
jgi:endo-1,4-beta-xylanase